MFLSGKTSSALPEADIKAIDRRVFTKGGLSGAGYERSAI
jgi:hypothetical protein